MYTTYSHGIPGYDEPCFPTIEGLLKDFIEDEEEINHLLTLTPEDLDEELDYNYGVRVIEIDK